MIENHDQRKDEASRLDNKVRLYGITRTVLSILVVAFMLVSSTINVWTLTEVQDQSKGNGATLARLIDCTTPGGTCYEESNARTGVAIASINKYTLAAAWCARRVPRTAPESQYRVCVTQWVADNR